MACLLQIFLRRVRIIFIKFLNACIANGVYFAPSKYEAGFISTQHDENILNMVLEKIELIVKEGL